MNFYNQMDKFDRKFDSWRIICLVLASIAGIVVLLFFFQVKLLLMLVLGVYVAVFSWYLPVPALIVSAILSTSVLQFVTLDYLPYLQLTSGIRLNALDLCLLMMFVFGLIRLSQRKERPLFWRPLLLIGAAILISLVVGVISDSTTVKDGLSGLRTVSGFIFYIALSGNITSSQQLKYVIIFVFILAFISVGVQVVEFVNGERLISGLSGPGYYSATRTVSVGNEIIPYLWNRAPMYLALCLFLAWGALSVGKKKVIFIPLFIICCFGFAITLVRSWFIFIAIGFAFTFILAKKPTIIKTLAIILVTLVIIYMAIDFASLNLPKQSFNLPSAIVNRMGTLLNFQQESTFQIRIMAIQHMWQLFLKSPVFGLGPGNGFYNSDVGMLNTLLDYGLVGWGAVILLLVKMGQILYGRFKQAIVGSTRKGYAIGLLGMWIGLISVFSFSIDPFFSISNGMAVGLLLVLIEKLPLLATDKITVI